MYKCNNIDEGVSVELINNFYSFHQRLMEASSRKIKSEGVCNIK